MADAAPAGMVRMPIQFPGLVGGKVGIKWKVTTVPESLGADRLARLLARLILEAENKTQSSSKGGCEEIGTEGRNREIPTTQEVSS